MLGGGPAQPEQASLWQDGLARFMAHLGKASRQVLETLAAHDGAWRSGEEISAATSIAPKGIGSVLSAIERTAALSQCPNPIERESRAEGAKALRVRMRPESLVVLKSAFAAAPTEEGAA